MLLLQTHGASPALAARIFKQYGDKAAGILQRSPYRLALDVRGVGFKTADNIARSLGISGDHRSARKPACCTSWVSSRLRGTSSCHAR